MSVQVIPCLLKYGHFKAILEQQGALRQHTRITAWLVKCMHYVMSCQVGCPHSLFSVIIQALCVVAAVCKLHRQPWVNGLHFVRLEST